MRTDGLTKAFVADGAVGKHRILTAGTNSGELAVAADGTAPLFAISTEVDAADTETFDAFLGGIAEVYYGGTVAFGARVTANAAGAAVAASGAGTNFVGIALAAGVNGDVGQVLICPGVL